MYHSTDSIIHGVSHTYYGEIVFPLNTITWKQINECLTTPQHESLSWKQSQLEGGGAGGGKLKRNHAISPLEIFWI